MAKRPVFTTINTSPFYSENMVDFTFHSGFSEVQKRKSIYSLHEAFLKSNPNSRILEISSKSENPLGIKLSAFNLMIKTKSNKFYSVETAFQSSKVFLNGGPYKDILEMTSRDAKKDPRLKTSGSLIHFNFFGRIFELNPTTYFYNWLYINALNMHDDLSSEILNFDAFTDIEFNPEKSLNCQARAASLFVSLCKNGLIKDALISKVTFLETVYGKNQKENNIIEQLGFDDTL